jgi:hypothetical protein
MHDRQQQTPAAIAAGLAAKGPTTADVTCKLAAAWTAAAAYATKSKYLHQYVIPIKQGILALIYLQGAG